MATSITSFRGVASVRLKAAWSLNRSFPTAALFPREASRRIDHTERRRKKAATEHDGVFFIRRNGQRHGQSWSEKVDRQHLMSLACQPSCEVLPAFFVKDGAMREHDSVIALSVEIPVDMNLVWSVERHSPGPIADPNLSATGLEVQPDVPSCLTVVWGLPKLKRNCSSSLVVTRIGA